jgi:hypothetical protein
VHVEPRHHTPRSDLPTRGGQVAAIAAAKGRPFMPWQQRAADVALEYDPDTGLYRYSTIIMTVQRQAGKTTWVGTLADHRCMRRPGARVWITMQSGKMANTWMRNEHIPSLKAFGNPKKASTPYRVSLRAEEVGVVWPALNSRFIAFPPKADALHSQQGDLIIVSEAWAFDAETGAAVRQAYRPTMLTRDGSQVLVESTQGDDSSVWFDGFLELGEASLSNPSSRVCFIDYGIPPEADAEDLDVIARHHPAYGLTISRQSLVDAREEFRADPALGGAAGWARAYGNRATRTREAAIPAPSWADAARPRGEVPTRAGIGLDVTPSGDRAAIGAGWRDDQGEGYGELLYAGPTARELPEMLAQLLRARRVPLVVDRGSIGALEVVDAVHRIAPQQEVRFLTMAEYAQACGTLYRGVLDDTFHHFNDPTLTGAVEVATKRDLGDGGFGWGRKSSAGSIAELVAVTVALKAFDLMPARRSVGLITL